MGVKEAGRGLWLGGGGCWWVSKIGATFLFFLSFFPIQHKEKHTNIDDHSKNIGTHNFCTHRKRIYGTGTH